ncbi:hypothetical protein RHMOL_Rhmol08G0252600 [Rhododendron molle]|uniref:Uncharacterized protein n=1 Tax=Rhododendron molle TaxID=49168 RepID=A0ACC0MSH8_RHOML|nr:hypothetical protein RHMOL_Rhmol08G0252600 [Rhododendron molle]
MRRRLLPLLAILCRHKEMINMSTNKMSLIINSIHQRKGGFVVAVDSSRRVKIALNGGWQVWEVSCCAGANGFIK